MGTEILFLQSNIGSKNLINSFHSNIYNNTMYLYNKCAILNRTNTLLEYLINLSYSPPIYTVNDLGP